MYEADVHGGKGEKAPPATVETDESLAFPQPTSNSARRISGETSCVKVNPGQVKTGVEMEASSAWKVRFTWRVVEGLSVPKYTYDEFNTETEAVDAVVSEMDRFEASETLLLVEAHVKGPGLDWRNVE